ncbi:MAG: hypothetical protein ACK2US_18320 [Anaerolineae bacterium]|jgi:hypothetical protein
MPPELTALLGGSTILIVILVCGSILVTTVITIGITWLAIRLVRKAMGPNRSILQNGIAAKAQILSVQQTGVMVNYQPQIAFQLEVHPPGGAPYQAQVKAVIPMVNIPQFQPGTEVPVKIHPTDPTQVVLDVYQT